MTYGFNHEEAVRSFKRAAELDPQMAMAWWGVAYALGPNINLDVDPDREKQAYELAQSAIAHARHASPKERDLIKACRSLGIRTPLVAKGPGVRPPLTGDWKSLIDRHIDNDGTWLHLRDQRA